MMMMKTKCDKCGVYFHKKGYYFNGGYRETNYCPSCGTKLEKWYEMTDLDKRCLMSMDLFVENVNDGFLSNDDGNGSYVKDGKVSNKTINLWNIRQDEFDYVCWYNK